MEFSLTDKEKRAIAALKRLEKMWPRTLWVFADGQSLSVMRKTPEGDRYLCDDGGMDPSAMVGQAIIPNDGGDW